MNREGGVRWLRLHLAYASAGLIFSFFGCNKSSDDEKNNGEDCYSPPREDTCENGGFVRRCYSLFSLSHYWPPMDESNNLGGGGAAAIDILGCPPADLFLQGHESGPCDYNLVEVCSEGELVDDECCYDGVYYQSMNCCG